jgi:hypothetical protein
LKTRKEIKEEIEATIRTLKNYHEAYHQREIPFDVMSDKARECHTTIGALKWVLGENDRYD